MRIILTAIFFIITFYGTTALMNKLEDKINNPVVVDRELAKWQRWREMTMYYNELTGSYSFYFVTEYWSKNP